MEGVWKGVRAKGYMKEDKFGFVRFNFKELPLSHSSKSEIELEILSIQYASQSVQLR